MKLWHFLQAHHHHHQPFIQHSTFFRSKKKFRRKKVIGFFFTFSPIFQLACKKISQIIARHPKLSFSYFFPVFLKKSFPESDTHPSQFIHSISASNEHVSSCPNLCSAFQIPFEIEITQLLFKLKSKNSYS